MGWMGESGMILYISDFFFFSFDNFRRRDYNLCQQSIVYTFISDSLSNTFVPVFRSFVYIRRMWLGIGRDWGNFYQSESITIIMFVIYDKKKKQVWTFLPSMTLSFLFTHRVKMGGNFLDMVLNADKLSLKKWINKKEIRYCPFLEII